MASHLFSLMTGLFVSNPPWKASSVRNLRKIRNILKIYKLIFIPRLPERGEGEGSGQTHQTTVSLPLLSDLALR